MEVVSDEENRRIAIVVYFENIEIYDELINRGNYKIIVYTKFRFYREKEWIAPNDKKFIYFNMMGEVYDKRQILILN